MRRESGFTLMELMITIAIIGIAAAFATPGVLQWLAGRKLTAGTQELLSVMQGARLTAVKENQPVLVDFDAVNDSYTVYVDANRNSTYDAGIDKDIGSGKMPAGVSITTASFIASTGGTSNQIGFNGEGLSSGTGSVRLTDKREVTRTLSVNMTGTIQVSG